MTIVPQKNEIKRAARLIDEFFNIDDESFWSLSPFKALDRVNLANITEAPLEVTEDKDKVYVEAELPGIAKEDIKVECENGVLSIEAQREEKKEEKNKTTSYSEFSYGKTFRRVNVGNVDSAKVKAEFKNGLLKVSLPKTEKESSKSIKVL